MNKFIKKINKDLFWIAGKHSIEAAIIKNKRKIFKVISSQKNIFLDNHKINYEIKQINFFHKLFSESHIAHQGIAALVSGLPNVPINRVLSDQTIVMLDGITDPMNIGTIIRNCIAFDVQSIIVKDREFNDKNAAMVKASSGAIDEINICKVANLNSALKVLKKNNFWAVCLDGLANLNIQNHKWNQKNVIILGSEGNGVSQLLKKECDYQIKIVINNKIESLNVNNAAAIALHSIKVNM
jgi:23S rRNA (guanosine2251-2'-O)-methyltransferase